MLVSAAYNKRYRVFWAKSSGHKEGCTVFWEFVLSHFSRLSLLKILLKLISVDNIISHSELPLFFCEVENHGFRIIEDNDRVIELTASEILLS